MCYTRTLQGSDHNLLHDDCCHFHITLLNSLLETSFLQHIRDETLSNLVLIKTDMSGQDVEVYARQKEGKLSLRRRRLSLAGKHYS